MSKIGHVLGAPEQAIVVFNGYMKPLDVSSMLKPQKNPKIQFGTFWTQIEQTSHCVKTDQGCTSNSVELPPIFCSTSLSSSEHSIFDSRTVGGYSF